MVRVNAINRVTLGSQVASELRMLMAKRELERGVVLGEEYLAEKFGVSRGPVRDALRILTNEGLAVPRGNRTEFRGLSVTDVDELFSLRQILESAALERALEKDRAALIDLMSSACDAMEKAAEGGSAEAFAAADMEYHSSSFIVAEHTRLLSIWRQYQDTVAMVLLASRETYGDLGPSIKSHHVLLDLVRTGDFNNIEYELKRHLHNANERARSFYEDPKEKK